MTKLQLITITMTIVVVLLCFVFVNTYQNDKPTYNPPTSSSTKNDNKTDTKQDDKPNVDPEPTTTDLLQLYDITATTDLLYSPVGGAYYEDHLTVNFSSDISSIFNKNGIYEVSITLELCGTYDGYNYFTNSISAGLTPVMTPKTSEMVGLLTLENSIVQNNTRTLLRFAEARPLPPKYGDANYQYEDIYAYTATIEIVNTETNTRTRVVCDKPIISHYNGFNEFGQSELTLTATRKSN